MKTKIFVLACALAGAVQAQPTREADAPAPLAALPYTPGLDTGAMDRDTDPCADFYQYSCGGWMRNNPIPSDQSRWSVYGKLAHDNQRYLWGILVQLGSGDAAREPREQKLGDFFAACMDTDEIERRAAAPMQAYLDLVDGIATLDDLPPVLARLHLEIGSEILFQFTSGQDYGDAGRVIAYARAADLSLPERDYFLKTDARSVALRASFVEHVARSFMLLGRQAPAARAAARRVLAFETAMAGALLSSLEKRDPQKLRHPASWRQLQAITPAFNWRDYLAALGLKPDGALNITEPAYLRALGVELRKMPVGELRDYLRWQIARQQAPYLPAAFADEHFAFYQHTLRGVPQPPARWERCVGLADTHLGEALGEEFVRRNFSPELKQQVLHMTRQIEARMREDIDAQSWMSERTRRKAQQKLAAVSNKIGYPDQWRDYGAYRVTPGDFAGNVARGIAFETRRQLAKIGHPLEPGQWDMSPATVNAYYDPQMNDVNFPAGVLQPPLYDPRMDAAPNYGNTGATIGHELVHGFDDEGRQFDAKGALKNWWSPRDSAAFSKRAQCVVDQYAQYTVIDDIKVNSKLTLGEDLADAGGLMLAWMAWKSEIGAGAQAPRDGLSAEQRFFVGYAQWTCESARPERLRLDAATDPHTPGRFRVNGVVANMPEFARAFACEAGRPMAREKSCRVW